LSYWNFTLLCGSYGNLIYDKAIPEYILVGLGYEGESPDYDSKRGVRHAFAPLVAGKK
jgi:hypothetical protein